MNLFFFSTHFLQMVLRVEIIEQRTLEDGTQCFIMYSAYASPAPLLVSNRDFCTFVIAKRTPEGDMLYCADSVRNKGLRCFIIIELFWNIRMFFMF